ncbi:MAG: PDZ domain-containing protein, partial [Gammaproteobacteria bacterium]
MEQIVKTGKVQRGYVGIEVQNLSPSLAEAFGIKQQSGAVVNSVEPDSPAEKAGLKSGDVITAINGKSIKRAWDVRNQVGLMSVGATATFDIVRNGKDMKLNVVLASAAEKGAGQGGIVNSRLQGVSVGNIEDNDPHYGKVNGVVVTDVARDSRSWHSGLRQGDIITSVDRRNVRNLKEFLQVVNKANGPLLLRIVRGNGAAFLVI